MIENSEVKNIVYARPDGQNDYNFRETRRPTHRRFALTFLFFKIRSSNFQSCFVSPVSFGFGPPWERHNFRVFENFKNDHISGQLYFFGIPNSENCAASRAAEAKRHRKWAFQVETKKLWNFELLILKNKKVRENLKSWIFLIFSNFWDAYAA